MTLTESGVAAELDLLECGNSTKLEVEVVGDYASFLDLERTWNRLAEQAALDHPFLEHVWIRTWWECFGRESRMHVMLVRENDELIGIAPLIETRVRMFGVTIRRLGFFYNSHVPRTGFLVARGSPDVHAAIWSHLLNDSRWDVLQLCQLEEGTEALVAMARLAVASGCRVETWMSAESPYVPIRTSWTEYFGGLSSKHRANLRNRLKRLSARGPVDMEAVSSAGLEQAIAEGMRLEAAAWKGDAGTAIGCDASLARFYSLLADRCAQRGWLRLRFLKSHAERIAFDYSLAYKDRIFLLKHGYDPHYSQFSPSKLLLQFAIEDAFEHRLTEYEILGDNTEWKQAWTNDIKKHFWLFVFSKSLKARYAHAAKFRVAPMLKKVIHR